MKKLFAIGAFIALGFHSAFGQDKATLMDSLNFRVLLAESAADHLVIAVKYRDKVGVCYYLGNLRAGLTGMSYDAGDGAVDAEVSNHLAALENRMNDASGYCGGSLADSAVKKGDLTALKSLVMTLPADLATIQAMLIESRLKEQR